MSVCTHCRFYSQDIRASAILNGDVEPPSECSDLYHILEAYTEAYEADWCSKNMRSRVNETLRLIVLHLRHADRLMEVPAADRKCSAVTYSSRSSSVCEESVLISVFPPAVSSCSLQTSSSSSAESGGQLPASQHR